MWIVTLLSIVGVVLNIHRRREGFIIWAFTNSAWAIYDFKIQAYAQSALFVVYFVLAIWGLFKWSEKNIEEERT